MEKISVIIPTWNRADMLANAINSAIKQTLEVSEILVCDDGSTDNSENIVKSIPDPRVKWIKGTHGGRPAIPRNAGLRECKGDWIAFLDSDDQWLPEKLERQMSFIKKYGVKAAGTNAYRNVPGKGVEGNLLSRPEGIITFSDLIRCNEVICSSCMIHSSLLDTIKSFPEARNVIEDYAFWLRVATQTNFIYVNEPLVIYNDDAANSVRSKDIQNYWYQRKYVFENFLEWYKSNGIKGSFKNEIRIQYLHTILRIVYYGMMKKVNIKR